MKRLLAFFLIATAFFAASVASADPLSLDVGAGTMGVSAGVIDATGSASDVRLTFGTFTFTRSQQFSNLVIDVVANLGIAERLRAQTLGLYVDRDLRGTFHLTGGLIYNQNRGDGTSVPQNSSVIIDGVSYSQRDAGVIYTTVTWPALAPYLGIGFGPRARDRRRFAMFGEAGAYYQGPAHVAFSATGAIEANYTKFQPYFDEGKRQLTTLLAPVQVYPVLQIGVRYRL